MDQPKDQRTDAQRISFKGPSPGKRTGSCSIEPRIVSKSPALLWIKSMSVARAVAAIIVSALQRARRSWRDSTNWCARLGGVGGWRSSAHISAAMLARLAPPATQNQGLRGNPAWRPQRQSASTPAHLKPGEHSPVHVRTPSQRKREPGGFPNNASTSAGRAGLFVLQTNSRR